MLTLMVRVLTLRVLVWMDLQAGILLVSRNSVRVVPNSLERVRLCRLSCKWTKVFAAVVRHVTLG